MRSFYLTLIILLFSHRTLLGGEFEFLMDCGSRTVFVGEKILCQFILVGDADVVEAEVVKFPEFRGFWSENLSLRQGPLALVPVPTRFGTQRQVVIGSYNIHRMVEKDSSEIIPMKISLRKRENSRLFSPATSEPIFLTSKSLPFSLVPLPQLPPQLNKLTFTGAVGEFFIPNSEVQVTYRLDEPFQIKVSLQGQGNFTEINKLPLSLPENFELISQRAFTQPSGNGIEKSFQFSILLKSSPPESFPLGTFIYFNPQKRKFETLNLPTLRLLQDTNKTKDKAVSFQPPAPEENWSPAHSWLRSQLFWFCQLIIFLACLFYRIQEWRRNRIQTFRNSDAFKRKQIWHDALEAQKAGNSIKFVQLATVMFTEILKEKGGPLKVRISHYPTKRQLIAQAKQSLSDAQLAPIEALFAQYDEIYSPTPKTHTLPPLIEALNESLNPKQ